jgi:hypothetical protein
VTLGIGVRGIIEQTGTLVIGEDRLRVTLLNGTPRAVPVAEHDIAVDLARDAAHNVDRPAAPLTTFVVGYAAAMRGGTEKDIVECTESATNLAAEWGVRSSR